MISIGKLEYQATYPGFWSRFIILTCIVAVENQEHQLDSEIHITQTMMLKKGLKGSGARVGWREIVLERESSRDQTDWKLTYF